MAKKRCARQLAALTGDDQQIFLALVEEFQSAGMGEAAAYSEAITRLMDTAVADGDALLVAIQQAYPDREFYPGFDEVDATAPEGEQLRLTNREMATEKRDAEAQGNLDLLPPISPPISPAQLELPLPGQLQLDLPPTPQPLPKVSDPNKLLPDISREQGTFLTPITGQVTAAAARQAQGRTRAVDPAITTEQVTDAELRDVAAQREKTDAAQKLRAARLVAKEQARVRKESREQSRADREAAAAAREAEQADEGPPTPPKRGAASLRRGKKETGTEAKPPKSKKPLKAVGKEQPTTGVVDSVIGMASEEIGALLDGVRHTDRDNLLLALGSEAAVKKFLRLSTKDTASAELDRITDSFTSEQERLVYGIGETGLQVDDLKRLHDAALTVDALPDAGMSEIARAVTLGMGLASPSELAALRSSSKGTAKVQEAFILVGGAFTEMKRRGLSRAKIDALVIAGMQVRGYSREDAIEVLADFLTKPKPTPKPKRLTKKQRTKADADAAKIIADEKAAAAAIVAAEEAEATKLSDAAKAAAEPEKVTEVKPKFAAEQWADLMLQSLPFNKLPPKMKAAWIKAIEDGTHTENLVLAGFLRGIVESEFVGNMSSAVDVFEIASEIYEYTADNQSDRVEQLSTIIDIAFFGRTYDNINYHPTKNRVSQPSAPERALEWLTELWAANDPTGNDRAMLEQQFMNVLKIEAVRSQTGLTMSVDGVVQPWAEWAGERELLPQIVRRFNITDTVTPPTEYDDQVIHADTTANAAGVTEGTTAAEQINQLLEDLVFEGQMATITLKGKAEAISAAWKSAVLKYGDVVVQYPDGEGGVLGQWFTDGKLNTRVLRTQEGVPTGMAETFSKSDAPTFDEVISGFDEPLITKSGKEKLTKPKTTKKPKRLTKTQKAEAEAEAEAAKKPPSDSGRAYRTSNNKEITNPLPRSALKNLLARMMRRYASRPKLHIYANMTQLRLQNRKLYNRAKAAHDGKTFEDPSAVAYSFGNEVIIFNDMVKTEDQVIFMVTHELMGHIGMRSIMTQKELTTLLNEAYDYDPSIRASTDRFMKTYDIPKLEAIEEVMANFAATLDASVMARISAVIKNFFNRLGFTFHDDIARLIVGQARRYTLHGKAKGRGRFGNTRTLAEGIRRIENERAQGRFYSQDDSLATAGIRAAGFSRLYGRDFIQGFKENWSNASLVNKLKLEGSTFSDLAGSLLEEFQTLDNLALRSMGLSRVFKVFQDQANMARRLLSVLASKSKFSTQSRLVKVDGEYGPTRQERLEAGELLARYANSLGIPLKDSTIINMDKWVTRNESGGFTINREVIAAALATVKIDRKAIQDKADRGENIFAAVASEDGEQSSPAWTPKFKITDRHWRIFDEQRAIVETSAIDVLEASFTYAYGSKAATFERLRKMKGEGTEGKNIHDADIDILRQIADEYARRYNHKSRIAGLSTTFNNTSVQDANLFIREVLRALHEPEKLQDWMDPTRVAKEEGATKFKAEAVAAGAEPELANIISNLERMHKLGLTEKQVNQIRTALTNMHNNEVQAFEAELYAKRTIMGAYVPFIRRGKWQVQLTAVDANTGEPVEMFESMSSILPYMQMESRTVAEQVRVALEEDYGGGQTFIMNDADGNDTAIKFVPIRAVARQSPPLSEIANYDEFIRVLGTLNLNLDPAQRHHLVERLARHHTLARKNLRRSGSPGWDPNVLRNVAEHVETGSHIAGKKAHSFLLEDILTDETNWHGDSKKLARLEAARDHAKNELDAGRGSDTEVFRTEQEYTKYAHMYRHMAPAQDENTGITVDGKPIRNRGEVTINGKQYKTLGLGERYKETAKGVLRWYSESSNIMTSTEDFLSQEYSSKLKLMAVMLQLGGSVASAAINSFSLVTHAIPYLATYNKKTGFGGGYGLAKASIEIKSAVKDMLTHRLAEAEYIEGLLWEMKEGQRGNEVDGWRKHFRSRDEAVFLLEETREGTLQAAQANALMGSARGVESNTGAGLVKGWMWLFSYTEQHNRRSTALAAYRLGKERKILGGATPDAFVSETLDTLSSEQIDLFEEARVAVNTSQGEYAMYNRPQMARGSVLQYVFMYKQFVIITVELAKNLSPGHRMLFIGALLFMAGVKGLPFAEDIMDLIDTLLEMFELKLKPVELMMSEFIHEIHPGLTPFVMRGVIDQFFAGTVSSRLGLGDNIPLTGAARADADSWREASNALGAVWSGGAGLVATGADLVRYSAEVVGLKHDTQSLGHILRNSPASAVRGVADAVTYGMDGVITNGQGRLVSEEASWAIILSRVLGFYPGVATKQNDGIRLARHLDAYAKALRAEHLATYMRASVIEDRVTMNRVLREVREWNRDAGRNSPFYIKNFRTAARRAAREAAKTAAERYLGTTSRTIRPTAEDIITIVGGQEFLSR